MKRFDYAADVAKQLITISSAIITVVVAFYDKFLSHSAITRIIMIAVLGTFALSIIFGIFSLGGLVSLVDRQERADQAPEIKVKNRRSFVRLTGSKAQRFAQEQQIAFIVGLILFLVFG